MSADRNRPDRRASTSGGIYRRHGKRLLDLALTVPALALLAPIYLLIAVAIRLDMGSPVLYRQRRPGRGEREFVLVKFRTMRDAAGPDGVPLPDGTRITRLGRFLRASSIDELPELLNILRGEMSLVGPRPLLRRYLAYYTPRERRRFEVPPGLTGWAQIHGRNELGWEDRLEHDVYYVEHCSLALDLAILTRTVGQVLTRRGVQVDPRSARRDLDEERRDLAG